MGRKKPVPQQMGEEERQQAQWNMLDIAGAAIQLSSDPLIVSDDDPALAEEKTGKETQWEENSQEVGLKEVGQWTHSAKPSSSKSWCDDTTVNSHSSGEDFAALESDGFSAATAQSLIPQITQQFFGLQGVQDELEELLTHAGICVPVYGRQHFRSRQVLEEWHWEAGKFNFRVVNQDGWPHITPCLAHLQECWLYFADSDVHSTKDFIYFEVFNRNTEKENKAKVVLEHSKKVQLSGRRDEKEEVKDHIGLFWNIRSELVNHYNFFDKICKRGQKKFILVFGEFDTLLQQVEITLYGSKEILEVLHYPSERFIVRTSNLIVQDVMKMFYNIPTPLSHHDHLEVYRSAHDFHALFEEVKSLQRSQEQTITVAINIQHPSLKPRLRPYQMDAIRWMLKMEHYGEEDITCTKDLHPLYTTVKTNCGKTLYYNRYGGSLVSEKPLRVTSLPGGILADEMGLGKTVEVLCCMLLHPRQNIALPERLPTLTETEEEGSHGEYPEDSMQTPESPQATGNSTFPVNMELVRQASTCSDSSSISSAPSEVVSYVVTPDHSYIKEQSGGDSEQAVTSQPSPSESVFKCPFDVAEQEQVMSEGTAQDIECQSETGSGSQPRCKKKRTSFTRKKRKSTKQRKGTEQNSPQLQDNKNNSSSSSVGKRKTAKNVRPSRFVSYVSEEEFQKFMVPKPLIVPQKKLFECACGLGEHSQEVKGRYRRIRKKEKHVVTCTECGTSQHAECLHYDLEDPFRGPYKCPHCHYEGKPIKSGATLIVSPFSICHQWTEEIKKHVRESSIKVFVYTGVSHQGYIQPQTLATQDIVITTYETLSKEINYVDLPHCNSDAGRRLRNPKKFMALPTPLTVVQWWRICLDEAQMVESVTSKMADMALRLNCVNRWCVTGTPLNNSVDDVFGLLAFIGFDPFCVDMWWKAVLLTPYLHYDSKPLAQALAKVMWRNTMVDVRDQLNLPSQMEEIYYLTFSPVEEVFYKQLHSSCQDDMSWVSSHILKGVEGTTPLTQFDQVTVAKLIRPLIKLRQACCHPQAVKGSFITVQESMLTMEQLLDNLLKKTKLDCMDAHRCLIFAMNGQAGIYLTQDPPQVAEAVAMYRAVLRSVDEHDRQKDQFQTDPLPHLHTLHNLKEVLDTKPEGVEPTLRDDLLGKQREEVKEKYMKKAGQAVTTAQEQLAPPHQAVQELKHQLDCSSEGHHWFASVLSHAKLAGNESELISKVHRDLTDSNIKKNLHFRNLAGLQYILECDLQELYDAYYKVLADMKAVNRIDPADRSIMESAIACCVFVNAEEPNKTCIFCKTSDSFENMETKLFNLAIYGRIFGGVDQHYRKGAWTDSALEVMLKSILSFSRHHHLDQEIIQAGSDHIRLFDAWKKEFKLQRALWTKLKEQVLAVHELEMAVTRMRVRLPGEELPGEYDVNVREQMELPSLLKKYANDQKIYAAELRVKCGTLEYLKNLKKTNQGELKDGINPDPCPICKEELGRTWCVLSCGHCFCMDCIKSLVPKRSHSAFFRCAFCREVMLPNDISYVSTVRSETESYSPSVKGSYPTKVAAVVQCIINIKKNEPDAKILVFASWIEVLKPVGKALEDHEISYTHLYEHGRKFQENVVRFKTDPQITALLMTYPSGSKGLNLFEANHILLVEPILNPAQEAQAIGRVYRMGQTKQTTVHRFFIKHTIEERIHKLMDTVLRPACKLSESVKEMMTVDQLFSLFQTCDNKEEESDSTRGSGSGHDDVSVSSTQMTRNGLNSFPSNDGAGPSYLSSNDGAGPSYLSSTDDPGPSYLSSNGGPERSTSNEGPGPSTLSSNGDPGPIIMSSNGDPGPSTMSSNGDPGPSTMSSNGDPGPSTLSSTGDPGPSTMSSNEDPGFSTMSSNGDPGPSTMSSNGDPEASTVSSNVNPGPIFVRSNEAPGPSTVSSNEGQGPSWLSSSNGVNHIHLSADDGPSHSSLSSNIDTNLNTSLGNGTGHCTLSPSKGTGLHTMSPSNGGDQIFLSSNNGTGSNVNP